MEQAYLPDQAVLQDGTPDSIKEESEHLSLKWNSTSEDLEIEEISKMAIIKCRENPSESINLFTQHVLQYLRLHPIQILDCIYCVEKILKLPSVHFHSKYWKFLLNLLEEHAENPEITIEHIISAYKSASRALPGTKGIISSSLLFLRKQSLSPVIKRSFYLDLLSKHGAHPESDHIWTDFLGFCLTSQSSDYLSNNHDLSLASCLSTLRMLDVLTTVPILNAISIISSHLSHPIITEFKDKIESASPVEREEFLRIHHKLETFVFEHPEQENVDSSWMNQLTHIKTILLDFLDSFSSTKTSASTLEIIFSECGARIFISSESQIEEFHQNLRKEIDTIANSLENEISSTKHYARVLGVDRISFIYRIALRHLLKDGNTFAARSIIYWYWKHLEHEYSELVKFIQHDDSKTHSLLPIWDQSTEETVDYFLQHTKSLAKFIHEVKEMIQTKLIMGDVSPGAIDLYEASLDHRQDNWILLCLVQQSMYGPHYSCKTKIDALRSSIMTLRDAIETHPKWSQLPPSKLILLEMSIEEQFFWANPGTAKLDEFTSKLEHTRERFEDALDKWTTYLDNRSKTYTSSNDQILKEYLELWTSRIHFEISYLKLLEDTSPQMSEQSPPSTDNTISNEISHQLNLIQSLFDRKVCAPMLQLKSEPWIHYMNYVAIDRDSIEQTRLIFSRASSQLSKDKEELGKIQLRMAQLESRAIKLRQAQEELSTTNRSNYKKRKRLDQEQGFYKRPKYEWHASDSDSGDTKRQTYGLPKGTVIKTEVANHLKTSDHIESHENVDSTYRPHRENKEHIHREAKPVFKTRLHAPALPQHDSKFSLDASLVNALLPAEVSSSKSPVQEEPGILNPEITKGRDSPEPPTYEYVPDASENISNLEQLQQNLLLRKKAKQTELVGADSKPSSNVSGKATLSDEQTAKLNELLNSDALFQLIEQLERSQSHLETNLERKRSLMKAGQQERRARLTAAHQHRASTSPPHLLQSVIDQNVVEWNALETDIANEITQFDREAQTALDEKQLQQQQVLHAFGVPGFVKTDNPAQVALQKEIIKKIMEAKAARKPSPALISSIPSVSSQPSFIDEKVVPSVQVKPFVHLSPPVHHDQSVRPPYSTYQSNIHYPQYQPAATQQNYHADVIQDLQRQIATSRQMMYEEEQRQYHQQLGQHPNYQPPAQPTYPQTQQPMINYQPGYQQLAPTQPITGYQQPPTQNPDYRIPPSHSYHAPPQGLHQSAHSHQPPAGHQTTGYLYPPQY